MGFLVGLWVFEVYGVALDCWFFGSWLVGFGLLDLGFESGLV